MDRQEKDIETIYEQLGQGLVPVRAAVNPVEAAPVDEHFSIMANAPQPGQSGDMIPVDFNYVEKLEPSPYPYPVIIPGPPSSDGAAVSYVVQPVVSAVSTITAVLPAYPATTLIHAGILSEDGETRTIFISAPTNVPAFPVPVAGITFPDLNFTGISGLIHFASFSSTNNTAAAGAAASTGIPLLFLTLALLGSSFFSLRA